MEIVLKIINSNYRSKIVRSFIFDKNNIKYKLIYFTKDIWKYISNGKIKYYKVVEINY